MSALASIVPLGYDDAFTPAELLKLHPELNGKVLMVNKVEAINYYHGGYDCLEFSCPVPDTPATTRDINNEPIKMGNYYVSAHKTHGKRVACLLDGKLYPEHQQFHTFRDMTLISGRVKASAECMYRDSPGGEVKCFIPLEHYNWIKLPMALPPDYRGSYTAPPGVIDLCKKDECCLDVIYLANIMPHFMKSPSGVDYGEYYAPTLPLRYYYEEWMSKRSSTSTPSLIVSDLLTC